jgi:GNAT superfamily N-acetyltransferase
MVNGEPARRDGSPDASGKEHRIDSATAVFLHEAEGRAWLDLAEAGRDDCGSGWAEIDGVAVTWLPEGDDPNHSCLIRLDQSASLAGRLGIFEEAARRGGSTILGINLIPGITEAISEAELTAAGYVRHREEIFWTRSLAGLSAESPADGIVLERAEPADQERYATLCNRAFGDEPGAAAGRQVSSAIDRPGWLHHFAVIDGEPAATSSLYLTDQVAVLLTSGTLPAYRGRGAQSALIHQRLSEARQAGCHTAVCCTVVDNASPRNMERHGFEQAFRFWIWSKRLTR